MKKTDVIFVGGFSEGVDGTVGGGVYACRSLAESRLSDFVQWHLIDATQRSLPPPPIPFRALLSLARMARLFLMLLTTGGPVLIFTSYSRMSFLDRGILCVMARMFRRRVVLSIRSEIRRGALGTSYEYFVRFILRRCAAIICQSTPAREQLDMISKRPLLNAIVIRNWIDASAYQVREGASGPTTRFLYLGWIERFKGVYELLDAAVALAREGLLFRIDFLGGGSELENLRRVVAGNSLEEHVYLHGWTRGPAKMDFLKSADVVVLPSYSEGLPNALLEAMASGLPVVATNVGGIPTLVTDQENGLLIEPKNARSLADAMRSLAQDPQRRALIGRKNREKVEREYDIDLVWPVVARALGVPPPDRDNTVPGEPLT